MAEEEVVETMESVADDAPVESIAEDDASDAPESIAEEPKGDNEVEDDVKLEVKEQQEYELAASEDFPVPEENLKSFTAAARKAGLTKEQAEAMLNWHKGFHGDVVKAQGQRMQALVTGWQKQIMADPEIGGEKWKESVAASRKALAAFDTEGELRNLLKEMNADYHPAVVRVISRVGRAMGEHEFVGAKSGGGRRDTPLEERMWPNMK